MLSVEQPLFPKDILGESPIIPYKDDLAEKYIITVLTLYTQLSRLPHLDPCPAVNTAFTALVTLCAETPSSATVEKILTDPRITAITPHLRALCSTGESRLESHWAASITASPDASTALHTFPYYTNYVDLTRMELSAITCMLPSPPSSFAFLGSGPLPLTSLCLADVLSQVRIHNVDYDAAAIAVSEGLCQKLGGRAGEMTFRCGDAGEQELAEFEVVYLAALVGRDGRDKNAILKEVVGRMRVGALLVVRSAHSLRGLLYPVVDAATDLEGLGLEPLLVVHPYNHIVNSVVVARVTGGKK